MCGEKGPTGQECNAYGLRWAKNNPIGVDKCTNCGRFDLIILDDGDADPLGTRESFKWRKGPDGPRTLCNACGLRRAKNKSAGIGGYEHPLPLVEGQRVQELDVNSLTLWTQIPGSILMNASMIRTGTSICF